LLTQTDKWKCAWSPIRLMTCLDKILTKHSATMLQFAMTWSLNSCNSIILYRWKFRSLCKIFLALQSDVPRATDYLVAERLGLLMNDCLTTSMFYGSHTVHTLPGGFFCNAEALALKLSTHNSMVLQQGMFPWWAVLKYLQNIHRTLTTVSIFKKCFNSKCMMLHTPMLHGCCTDYDGMS
jgi:hypothetical protein